MTSMSQTTEDTIDSDTETGSMSADTAALGGGVIADTDVSESDSVRDADGGAR